MGRVTITAQVEFDSEAEVALATELLKTIQQLTSSFSTTVRPSPNVPSKPSVETSNLERNKSQAQDPLPVKAASPAPQIPAATTPAVQEPPQTKQASNSGFAFKVAANEKQMEELVYAMEDRSKHSAVIEILHRSLDENRDVAFQMFFDIFIGYLFHPDPSKRPSEIEAYLSALMELKDPWRDQARSPLTTKLLKQLTVKRPVDCDRLELIGHAEAFAVLVKFEVIAINAAATTLARLLKKSENRAAAITTLGKTVEICDEILEDLGPGQVDELKVALQGVTEPVFAYDVQVDLHCPKFQTHGSSQQDS